MRLDINPAVQERLSTYPKRVQNRLGTLRNLIIKTAEAADDIDQLEETLKWGEPSYLSKIGSTVRMDWKAKKPNQYAIYFKCTSKLVKTFKEVYGDLFKYETTRAIVFDLDKDEIPEKELSECIMMALRYHKLKNLPLLGAK